MNRNQNHDKLSTKHEESLYFQGFHYTRTETTPQLLTESKLAKQILLSYAFNSIFSKVIQSQKSITSKNIG